MKCSKCKCNNILRANYCKKCGTAFSEQKKKKSYQKTIYYKLEQLQELYDTMTLSKITSNMFFRGAILLITLFIGVYSIYIHGNQTKIEKSDLYKVYCNRVADEYYLITTRDQEKVNLNLYIPNRTKKLTISHFQTNGNLISNIAYKKGKEITLQTFDDDYYVLYSNYSHHKKSSIKLYLYNKSDLENLNFEK